MKQITAVEWVAEEAMNLVKQYMNGTLNEDTIEDNIYKIIIRGKEIEKKNIINAWMATDNELQRLAAEKYYNETFKSE